MVIVNFWADTKPELLCSALLLASATVVIGNKEDPSRRSHGSTCIQLSSNRVFFKEVFAVHISPIYIERWRTQSMLIEQFTDIHHVGCCERIGRGVYGSLFSNYYL